MRQRLQVHDQPPSRLHHIPGRSMRSWSSGSWDSQSGFTLLEVMIAMAILAIVLVAAYQSQSQSISMSTNARFITTASLLAQDKMAEIESQTPVGMISGDGDFGEHFPGWHWKVEISDSGGRYMKKVALTITNEAMRTNNTYRIILYRIVPG
jgi:general secretion pathway protein I